MNIELIPLEGIKINGLFITFGKKINEISEIGELKTFNNKVYYWKDELGIHCNENSEIEYLEFLGGYDGKLRPTIYGNDFFEMGADDAIKLLTEKNKESAIDENDSKPEYSYTFNEISVGLTREIAPWCIDQDIKEAKANGSYDEKKESYDLDYFRSRHFDTIGIGVKNYYKDAF